MFLTCWLKEHRPPRPGSQISAGAPGPPWTQRWPQESEAPLLPARRERLRVRSGLPNHLPEMRSLDPRGWASTRRWRACRRLFCPGTDAESPGRLSFLGGPCASLLLTGRRTGRPRPRARGPGAVNGPSPWNTRTMSFRDRPGRERVAAGLCEGPAVRGQSRASRCTCRPGGRAGGGRRARLHVK